MISLVVLGLAILVQISAVILALRLIPVSRGRLAWILIAAGVILLLLRLALAFLLQLQRPPHPLDLPTAIVSLAIAVLLALGIAFIGPLFQAFHQTEEALREEHRRAEQYLDVAGAIFMTLDTAGRVTLINRKGCEILGARADTIIGQHWFTTFVPESMREMVQLAFDMMIQGDSASFEYFENLVVTARGEERWIAWHNATLTDDAGRIIGVLCSGQDVTEHQLADKALRSSEERLRLLSNAAFEGIMIHRQGIMLEMNRAFATMFGYEPSELIGKRGPELALPEYQEAVLEHIRTDSEEPYEAEYRRRDGSTFIAETRGRRITYRGQDARVVAIHDITERKLSEERVARERAFLYSAIDIMPFPIAFVSPAERIILVNKAGYDFFGETVHEEWWDIPLLTPDTHTSVPREEWPVMRALRGDVVLAFEGIRAFPDGREVPVLVHAAPVTVGGQLVAAVVAFQDITALKEADRTKDEFLAILSHELLVPVTSFLGWLQVAKEDPEIVPEALDVLQRSARRQEHLVGELLDFSRVRYRKLRLTREDANLWSLAAQTAGELLPMVQGRGLTLELEPPDEPLPVCADVGRLRQVISNLLTNAMKFTDAGGSIYLSAHRTNEMAVLAVRDTGHGIPPDQLQSVFEPFQQAQQDPAKRGLGLGLALVKGIVELHGGRVSAESPGLGQGTTFTVMLPLRDAPAPR